MKRVVAAGLLVLVVLASASSCTPAFDQLTLDHLRAIRVAPVLASDSCAAYIAYEQAKLDSKSPMRDKKSRRNVGDACDCVTRAGPDTTSIVRRSCMASIQAYEAYELAKKPK